MKPISIFLGMALAVIALHPRDAFPAFAGDRGTAPDRFEAVRESILQRMKEDPSIPSIAVGVARDGKILWEEGFGWADRERRLASTPHTPYSVASVSKPITATGLMTLVRDGKVDLDSPANDYLGAVKLRAMIGDARDASIRRLANHTAGLPRHYQFFYADEPWRRPSEEETLRRYGNLVTPPGDYHEYSNLGYGVLDNVISRVSGQTYAQYMEQHVFVPLGLEHTSVDIAPRLRPIAATRYGEDGKPLPFYDVDHPGASSVYSSAHDLLRFAMFHLKDRLSGQEAILDDAAIDAMHAPTASNGRQHSAADLFDDGYGIGFVVDRQYGHRIVWHDGGMGGVSSMMKILPDQDIAVVVLTNSRNHAPRDISHEILRTLLPEIPARAAAKTETAYATPQALLGRWSGHVSTYAGDMPVVVEFLADDRVRARIGTRSAMVKYPGIKDGHFTGEVEAPIDTPDSARFPGRTRLALNLRGNALNGSATTVHSQHAAQGDVRTRNALSHWISLHREP